MLGDLIPRLLLLVLEALNLFLFKESLDLTELPNFFFEEVLVDAVANVSLPSDIPSEIRSNERSLGVAFERLTGLSKYMEP